MPTTHRSLAHWYEVRYAASSKGRVFNKCAHLSSKSIPEMLTVVPKQHSTAAAAAPAAAIACYRKIEGSNSEDGSLFVPRAFGLKHFGAEGVDCNSLVEGQAMRPECQFAGTLLPERGQPVAVDAACDALRDPVRRGGLVCAKTGSGKTTIAIAVACRMRVQTWILVHTSLLFAQWPERIRQFAPGAQIATVRGAARKKDAASIASADFVVAMAPTLYNRDANMWDSTCGLLIVDECHHMGAKTFYELIPRFRCAYVLGLTATPRRRDGLADLMYWFIGDIVKTSLSADQELTIAREPHPEVEVWRMEYVPPNGEQPREVVTSKGNVVFHVNLKKLYLHNHARNQFVASVLRQLLANPARCVLVFSKIVAHLEALQQLVPGDLLVQSTSREMREHILAHSRVIYSTYVMCGEAWDCARINAVVMALPTGDAEQPVGRIRLMHTAEERRVQKKENRHPVVVDIWDDWSIFAGMSYKRMKLYRSPGFQFTVKQFRGTTQQHVVVADGNGDGNGGNDDGDGWDFQ